PRSPVNPRLPSRAGTSPGPRGLLGGSRGLVGSSRAFWGRFAGPVGLLAGLPWALITEFGHANRDETVVIMTKIREKTEVRGGKSRICGDFAGGVGSPGGWIVGRAGGPYPAGGSRAGGWIACPAGRSRAGRAGRRRAGMGPAG